MSPMVIQSDHNLVTRRRYEREIAPILAEEGPAARRAINRSPADSVEAWFRVRPIRNQP